MRKQNHPTAGKWWSASASMRAALFALGAGFGLSVAGCGDDSNPNPNNQNPGNQNPGTQNPGNQNRPSPDQVAVRPVVLSEAGHDRLFGAVYDDQGNLYATGVVADGVAATDDFSMVVVKFLPNGDRDTSFGTNGVARKNVAVGTNGELARGIVIQSTGKIVISGTIEHVGATDARDRDIALVRFNTDGSVDDTFGTNGVATFDLSTGEVSGTSFVADTVWGLTRLADDRLVFVGAQKADGRLDTDFVVARLTADGARDNSFDTDGVMTLDIDQKSASPKMALPLADGKLIISGYMRNADDVVVPVLFRLHENGTLDTSFGVSGVFNPTVLGLVTEVYATALQGEKIVTTGYGRNAMTESLDWVSLRVNANGTLDNTYGTNGVARVDLAGFNDNSRNMVVLPDTRVLLIGGARPAMDDVDAMVQVLSADGQPDITFFGQTGQKVYDLGGAADFFWGIAISPDKKNVAVVGLKGNAASSGMDDDGALLVLPL